MAGAGTFLQSLSPQINRQDLHLDEASSVQQTLQDLPVSHKTVAQTFVMGMAGMCQYMLEQSRADLQSSYILLPLLSSAFSP